MAPPSHPAPADPPGTSTHTTAGRRYLIPVSTRGLPRLLTAIVVALLVIHVAFQYDRFYSHRLPWELHALFDLDEEQSVPTWYSAAALGLAAALLAAIASGERRAGTRDARWWARMAWVLLYLSFDEVAGVHETVNSLSYLNWTIPFGLLALAVGAAYLPFVLRLPAPTRWGIIVAGIVYVAGAVGIEFVTTQFFGESNKRQFLYALITPVEEGGEMFGIVILIHTLLRHMERAAGGAVEIELAPAPRETPRG